MTRPFSCTFPLAMLGLLAVPASGQVEPLGELGKRIELVHQRLLKGETPAFTQDFILADVMLRPDYPRRFDEYSGDLSGRYVGAVAMLPPPGGRATLEELVKELVRYQKGDGRFGNEALVYSPEAIDKDHMALLWGNGRLLVGLLEYLEGGSDDEVLAVARRLGDFLVSVQESCANEAVQKRVEDFGAAGMICFSHLIEGLVMLADATGDQTYVAAAEEIVPWFPVARGHQHTHGYLTTLRAILMLHEATGRSGYFDMVERLYDELVQSPDYLIYGGVKEYFGGRGDRDEGCSEADFLRLSLQLWKATGNVEYLERAERCLLNQFYANQFVSGDFGHQLIFEQGIAPYHGTGRAWWCCTMHGLRAFRDVLDALVYVNNDVVRVVLFQDARWSQGDTTLLLERDVSADRQCYFAVTVERAPENGVKLALRKPRWAEAMALEVDGQAVKATEQDGYMVLGAPLKKGSRVEVTFSLKTELVLRDGTRIVPEDLPAEGAEAAVFHGPWLMGVDEAYDPLFFGEPWGDNRILLRPENKGDAVTGGAFGLPVARIWCTYTHGGFPDVQSVVLRPISERTAHEQATCAVWLRCRPAGR